MPAHLGGVDREGHGHDGLAAWRRGGAASSSPRPRGSARRTLARRISSSRARFASEVMVTITKGRPSVVFPTSSTLTRSEARRGAPGSRGPGPSRRACGRRPGGSRARTRASGRRGPRGPPRGRRCGRRRDERGRGRQRRAPGPLPTAATARGGMESAGPMGRDVSGGARGGQGGTRIGPRRSPCPSSATWSPSRSRRTRRPTGTLASDLVSVAPLRRPGGPEGRARGAHARRARGLPRRLVPLPARATSRRSPRSSTTRRPRRTTAASRSPCCATPRSRPASCCRCARTRAPPRSSARRGSGSGPGGGDAEHLSRGVFETYTKENLRYSQTVPLTMYDEANSGTNLPGADRPLRDRRHGVPLPDGRQGRRLREQDLPLPGDEGAAQPGEPREVPRPRR